jgi:hypothetical protein
MRSVSCIADFRNAVWRLSPDGEVEKFADGLCGASGNAIGPRGYLYQSSFNGNFVSRISRTGEVETWVDEGLAEPVASARFVPQIGVSWGCRSGERYSLPSHTTARSAAQADHPAKGGQAVLGRGTYSRIASTGSTRVAARTGSAVATRPVTSNVSAITA